jgi:hypothetical protein
MGIRWVIEKATGINIEGRLGVQLDVSRQYQA